MPHSVAPSLRLVSLVLHRIERMVEWERLPGRKPADSVAGPGLVAIALGSRWAEGAIVLLDLVRGFGLEVQYGLWKLYFVPQPFEL